MYLRKWVLQHLYPNKFSTGKCLERTECTSAVCDNTAVVSQRNWSLSVSSLVHKHCINSYSSCIRQFQTILRTFKSHNDAIIAVTTVVGLSEHFNGITAHYWHSKRCAIHTTLLYSSILAIFVYLCDWLTWQHQLLQLCSNFS